MAAAELRMPTRWTQELEPAFSWNTNGISIKNISLLDSPTLTEVTTFLTIAEDPQHVTELPFYHVEELHIVFPDPTYFPLLAPEFNDVE